MYLARILPCVTPPPSNTRCCQRPVLRFKTSSRFLPPHPSKPSTVKDALETIDIIGEVDVAYTHDVDAASDDHVYDVWFKASITDHTPSFNKKENLAG